MPQWMIPDMILAIVILVMLFNGYKKGLILMCGKFVSLGGAFFGAKYAGKAFSESMAQKWIVPYIEKLLTEAKDRLCLQDTLDSIGSVLDDTGLPEFLRTGISETISKAVTEKGESALSTASNVIAQRLSEWIIITIAAILIYQILQLLIRKVLNPLIQSIPIVSGLNKTVGALLGCGFGVIVAGIVLWVGYTLFPALSQSEGMLSSSCIDQSHIVKFFFQQFPKVFGI